MKQVLDSAYAHVKEKLSSKCVDEGPRHTCHVQVSNNYIAILLLSTGKCPFISQYNVMAADRTEASTPVAAALLHPAC